MSNPKIIEDLNLSVAWNQAFLQVLDPGELSPLVVVIKNIAGGKPREDLPIRRALDDALESKGRASCETVANTIFPNGLWNSKVEREFLFDRYLNIYPRLRRADRRNKYGLYFQRLVAFGCNEEGKCGFNQLEHILSTWNKGNHRRTALQASLFDPYKDHTDQRQRGFPCLQQVAFAPNGQGGLAVTGFYATQYMIEKAYGNYLGLCRLGQFMAHEMGLTLDQITCIASPAKREWSKSDAIALTQNIEEYTKQLGKGDRSG